MDLEVVGRHALLFDDDATAALVNSGDTLVEWHSLQIDRFDVRHLLSAPPPPRRRNLNAEPLHLPDLSMEPEIDHERYLDLPLQSDQPDVEEDERQSNTSGYNAVGFSYGNTSDSTEQKNTDIGMESSRFIPQFPVPGNLLNCLPPTEKVHEIIARTAMFVIKHGGQSEIILRVKQGDNPTFGFLMPDHHLHSYFRFLIEHPELLNSESDDNPQDAKEKVGGGHNISNGSGGALSLLGSVYGFGEEEENDSAKTQKDVSQDITASVDPNISQGSRKIQGKGEKDESALRNASHSNKEKVLAVKKNSLISASKSGTVKGVTEKTRLFSTAADKANSLAVGMNSTVDPVVLEPPHESKRLVDKIVEFIMRNGKEFEATLIEQDRKVGRFPFLLPSDRYHSYYLKVLQKAQESKLNGKSSYSGTNDLVGRGMDKKDSVFREKRSTLFDIPPDYDKKEKFKMVIGKSKKEGQEMETKGTQQEYGNTVDAASAAAILQAATRGIKNYSAVEKSVRNEDRDDPGEKHLTKEQKLKAERLKRAKMFVALLKSGEMPFKTGTSRGSSMEPLESGVSRSPDKVSLDGEERESSVAPADVERPGTGEKPEENYFREEHAGRLSKRKYRTRLGACDDGEDEDTEEHLEHVSRRGENVYAVEMERKQRRRRHHTHSSSEENRDDADTREEERKYGHSKSKRQSHHSSEDEHDDRYEKDKNHKRSRKKHRHDTSDEHSRKSRSSKRYMHNEEDQDDNEREKRRSRKKHRSHRSSHHSKDKHRQRSRHSSRNLEPKHSKHETSSDDDHQEHTSTDKHRKESSVERNGLEEGEISSRDATGIASGQVSRETSVDVASSHQRAASETTAEVPEDLRAKIRAMLMATRL